MDTLPWTLIWIVIASALARWLLFYTRIREVDQTGNPILKYLATPYIMLACAILFLVVSAFQWLDPFNHLHSGNLLLLSYIPGAAGAFTLCVSIYTFRYRVTLLSSKIEVSRWPWKSVKLALTDIQKFENNPNNFVLSFNPGGQHVFYKVLSGHVHFLEQLKVRGISQ